MTESQFKNKIKRQDSKYHNKDRKELNQIQDNFSERLSSFYFS